MRKTPSRACVWELSRSLGGSGYAEPWREAAGAAVRLEAFTATTAAVSSLAAAGALEGAAGADCRSQHAPRSCAWSCKGCGQCMSCASGEGHSLAGMDTHSAIMATGCASKANTSATAASLKRFSIAVSISDVPGVLTVMIVTRACDNRRDLFTCLLDVDADRLVIRQSTGFSTGRSPARTSAPASPRPPS